MNTQTPEWLTLALTVPADRVEVAEQTLFDIGALSVTLLDAADHPLHEPAPGEQPLWPRVIVQALFPGNTVKTGLTPRLLAAGLVDSATAMDFSNLVDRDWQRAWMDQFRPMRFGRDLWICPTHLEPSPDWPLVVRLDPGLAFGSGTHPTTALCLEWIDGAALDGQTVIDYGCGSGILAMAAALKGATRVLAVDYDPQALTATGDNAQRNAVSQHITTIDPEGFGTLAAEQRQAQLVLANILAQPLIELAPLLMDCVRPGGHLVLSGILPEQAGAVAAAYHALDPQAEVTERDGWIRLVISRPAQAGSG